MRFFSVVLSTIFLVSCANHSPPPAPKPPTESFFTSSDGKQLSLRHWNIQKSPNTFIIALHGIAGAAIDFERLAKQLPSDTALYALNLRGLGYDPNPKDRGDIRTSKLWLRDLTELDQTLRHQHPGAKIVWLGESMGALIALHAATTNSISPDALILTSPVTSLKGLPTGQRRLLRLAARLFPTVRISLESLAGDSFRATTQSEHFDQSARNPWHIEAYTLRFLATLGDLAEDMPRQARKFHKPVLILFGGKDQLIAENELQCFAEQFPGKPVTIRFSQSHHLLFYDKQHQHVIRTILKNLP